MTDSESFRRGFYTTLGVFAAFLLIDLLIGVAILAALIIGGVHASDITK